MIRFFYGEIDTRNVTMHGEWYVLHLNILKIDDEDCDIKLRYSGQDAMTYMSTHRVIGILDFQPGKIKDVKIMGPCWGEADYQEQMMANANPFLLYDLLL